ncbi:MAG: DUF1330 domain-containing protein [Rhodospirillales bacterium]|nr:DUF1330 domain-containing protein [Rhodospirillales bacterium]
MPAYMIVDIDVRDAAAYEEYKRDVPALIARHGGEYLVRGGEQERLEGDWKPARLVLLRFPDRAAIRRFLADPDYADLKALRHRATVSKAVAVDGIA